MSQCQKKFYLPKNDKCFLSAIFDINSKKSITSNMSIKNHLSFDKNETSWFLIEIFIISLFFGYLVCCQQI